MFLLSTDFFLSKIRFFKKLVYGYHQTVWIQIRPDIMSGLIWVQTVCNGYRQMILVGKEFSVSMY